MLKLLILYLLKIFLSIFKIFSIKKNRFFFISYQGKQYSCNPKAIYEYLCNCNEDNEYVWCVNKGINVPDINGEKLICVEPKTLKYYHYLITSHFVFTNIQLPTYIPKNKKSVWINTWHGGGAYKRVETPESNLYEKVTKKIQIKNTNYYISSSEKFTEVMSESTGIPKEKFLKIGMPRNDIFFAEEDKKSIISEKVRNKYGIKKEDFCVLYAPTYRGNLNSGDFKNELDVEMIKEVITKKFCRHVVLFIRSHHAAGINLNVYSTINVTDYPDMQDLLVAADCLITDYSSCIWDFALTSKPGFLFTTDLEEYKNNRGFYMNIEDWCYEYGTTNKELADKINKYDVSDASKKIELYLENMGNYDVGKACHSLLKKVLEM